LDPMKLAAAPSDTYDLSNISIIEPLGNLDVSSFVRQALMEKIERKDSGGWLKVHHDTMMALMKLLYSTGRGFTSDLDDNFWRMWYFSCTTITTVGFGDIVPVTPAARSLVAVEALVGAIIFGLFLLRLSR